MLIRTLTLALPSCQCLNNSVTVTRNLSRSTACPVQLDQLSEGPSVGAFEQNMKILSSTFASQRHRYGYDLSLLLEGERYDWSGKDLGWVCAQLLG